MSFIDDLKKAYEKSYPVGVGPKQGLKRLMGNYSPLGAKQELEKQEKLKKTEKKDTKTASTSKSSNNSSDNTTVQTSVVSNTPSGGYMDWMTSEYGSSSSSLDNEERYNANSIVWNDPALSKVDTAVVSRYYKNNLQDLVNLYQSKISETLGQKRG